MRNSWPWKALTSVAIAAASTAWAQAPGGAGSPSAEGTHEPTPKMQGDDNAQGNGAASQGESNDANGGTNHGANGSANGGPSPRDQPAPGLRLDDRMNRLPAQRQRNGANDPQGNGSGADNGSDDGTDNGTGQAPSEPRPANPANPATPLFPANPHPNADPGAPGNPVQPTRLRFA